MSYFTRFIILVIAIISLHAQQIRYSNELNHIPLGCRSVAMGNSFVSLTQNSYGAFWNPSIISFANEYEVWLEGAKLYGGMSDLGFASLSAPIPGGSNVGILYTAFFSGDIIQQDSLTGTPLERLYNPNLRPNENTSTGIFRNNHNVVVVTTSKIFSIPLPRPSGFTGPLPLDIAGGFNIKYYWQTMDPYGELHLGMNINVDLGLTVKLGVDYDFIKKANRRELILGISVKDLLPTKTKWINSYNEYTEPVDNSRYYGLTYTDRSGFLHADWTASMELHKSYNVTTHLGLEAVFKKMIAIRLGLSDGIPTFGAGVTVKFITIEYACSFDELAFTPIRLSLGVKF